MTMVPRDPISEDQIAAAKKMPTGPTVDNAGNPINSPNVADAMTPPSGGTPYSNRKGK